MKLYTENKNEKVLEIFELNNETKKNFLYMMENSKISKLMMNKIKKSNLFQSEVMREFLKLLLQGY